MPTSLNQPRRWHATLALFLIGAAAHARPPVTWAVDSSGSWTTAANWSSNPALPGAADDVTINRPAGDFEITVPPGGGAQTINSLALSERLRIDAGATLTTLNGLTLNGGSISLVGGASTASLLFDGNQTLGGSITIDFNGTSNANTLAPAAPGQTLTIGPGIVIRSGTTGGNFGIPGGGATIDLGGVLRTIGSNTITIRGTLNMTGAGNCQTNSGGTFILDGATMNNGLFDGVGSVFANNNSVLDNVSFDTGLMVSAGHTVTIKNGLTLDGGSASLVGSASPATMIFDGTQTLNGPSPLVFNGSNANNIARPAAPGQTLTIGQSVTVRTGTTGGTLGLPGAAIINRGTISAQTSGQRITLTGTNNENFGVLRATIGAVLVLSGSLELHATAIQTTSNGVVRLSGVALRNGSITGTGSSEMTSSSTLSSLTLGVPLSVGGGATATIEGNVAIQNGVSLNSSSGLEFPLAGTVPVTDFGVLNVTVPATLAGELRLTLVGAYQPEWNDHYTIITGSALSGSFSPTTFAALADPPLRWWTEMTPTSVTARVRHVADPNLDEAVNFADITFVLASFGQSGSGLFADTNENGTVDFGDITLVLTQFGAQAP